MNRTFQRHSRERGQATLEMLLMLPLLMGVFFLGLAIAVLWHAHALSAHLALEGASRDGVNAGQGVGFSAQKKAEVAPSFSIGPQVQIYSSGVEGQGEIFTMQGSARIPWSPLGLVMSTLAKASSLTPVWKFVP